MGVSRADPVLGWCLHGSKGRKVSCTLEEAPGHGGIGCSPGQKPSELSPAASCTNHHEGYLSGPHSELPASQAQALRSLRTAHSSSHGKRWRELLVRNPPWGKVEGGLGDPATREALELGLSILTSLTPWPGSFPCCGAVLCFAGCLAASPVLAPLGFRSTH